MRHLLLIIFLFLGTIAKANQGNDTVPYWHISYGKEVVIRGSVNTVAASNHEIILKAGAVKDLSVSFVYEDNQPKTSLLTVKEKNDTLRILENDPEMGSYFVVPVRELIGLHQPNVQYELDFYYTDDRGQKNLKLGTIIFILK